MMFLKAFLVGGLICGIVQILIDKTKLTPARILVGLVISGVVLGALGSKNWRTSLSTASFSGSIA